MTGDAYPCRIKSRNLIFSQFHGFGELAASGARSEELALEPAVSQDLSLARVILRRVSFLLTTTLYDVPPAQHALFVQHYTHNNLHMSYINTRLLLTCK
jgi:hypothetical protein